MSTQNHAVLAMAEDWLNQPSTTSEERQAQYHHMMGTTPNEPPKKSRADQAAGRLQSCGNVPAGTK